MSVNANETKPGYGPTRQASKTIISFRCGVANKRIATVLGLHAVIGKYPIHRKRVH